MHTDLLLILLHLSGPIHMHNTHSVQPFPMYLGIVFLIFRGLGGNSDIATDEARLSDLAEVRTNDWAMPLDLVDLPPQMADSHDHKSPQPVSEKTGISTPPRLTPSPDATESGSSWLAYHI